MSDLREMIGLVMALLMFSAIVAWFTFLPAIGALWLFGVLR